MSARLTFGDYLHAEGLVPEGVDIRSGSSLVGVLDALLRELPGPNSLAAFPLFLQIHQIADEHSRVTGTPRLAAVRASPIGDVDRRAIAGVLGGSL